MMSKIMFKSEPMFALFRYIYRGKNNFSHYKMVLL